mgnify:CR=1 FL=1
MEVSKIMSSDMGKINNLKVKDMDFTMNGIATVRTDPPLYHRDTMQPYKESEVVLYISHETIIKMYEHLMSVYDEDCYFKYR